MSDPRSLYQNLISASQEAFEQRLYDVAYNALAGALSSAQALLDAGLVTEVSHIASRQLATFVSPAEDRTYYKRLYTDLIQQANLLLTQLKLDENDVTALGSNLIGK